MLTHNCYSLLVLTVVSVISYLLVLSHCQCHTLSLSVTITYTSRSLALSQILSVTAGSINGLATNLTKMMYLAHHTVGQIDSISITDGVTQRHYSIIN